VLVRQAGDRWQLIAGERRVRAAQQLGWTDVAVHVIEVDDRQLAEAAIVENLQRKDLNPMEKASAFQDYLARYHTPQEELAKRLGVDRSTVANFIRLLELPESVRDAVRSGSVSAGHARALLPLGEEAEQISFCQKIQAEGWSVRTTEQAVRDAISAADADPSSSDASPEPKPLRTKSAHLASLEQQFRSALGAKVDIKPGSKDQGKVVIHFRNHDEFERLRDLLCSAQPLSAAG